MMQNSLQRFEIQIFSGLIMYKGGLLDIEKLISQLSRSEKGRTDTEQMLVEVKHRNSDLSSDNTKAHGTIKELNDKLSDYRSKLWASEREIKDYKVSFIHLFSILLIHFNNIYPYIFLDKNRYIQQFSKNYTIQH